jgi:hypothetical protein
VAAKELRRGRQSTADSFGKTKDNAEAQRALRFAEYGEEWKLRRGRQSTVDPFGELRPGSSVFRKREEGNFTAEAQSTQRFGEEFEKKEAGEADMGGPSLCSG